MLGFAVSIRMPSSPLPDCLFTFRVASYLVPSQPLLMLWKRANIGPLLSYSMVASIDAKSGPLPDYRWVRARLV